MTAVTSALRAARRLGPGRPGWAHIRALAPFAPEERRLRFGSLDSLLTSAGAALFPPESAADTLLDILFEEQLPTADDVFERVLFPWLERLAVECPEQLEAVGAAWPPLYPLTEERFRALARRGVLTGQQLLALARSAGSAAGMVETLAGLPDGAEAVVLPLLLSEASPEDLLELWAAGVPPPYPPMSSAPVLVPADVRPRAPRTLPAWWEQTRRAFQEAARRRSGPRWCPIRLLRLAGDAVLLRWYYPDEECRSWLRRAVRRPALAPVWPRLRSPLIVLPPAARHGRPAGEDRTAAVLTLLDDPPPGRPVWTLRLLRAVHALRAAKPDNPCLPWRVVRQLLRRVAECSRPDALVQIGLEGMLPDGGGHCDGLSESIQALLRVGDIDPGLGQWLRRARAEAEEDLLDLVGGQQRARPR
jgi:hypothetical protein